MCIRCVMEGVKGMELVVLQPIECAGVQVPMRACFVPSDPSVTLDLFYWRWGTPKLEAGLFSRRALSTTDAYRALQNPTLLIQISAARYLDLRRQIRRSCLPEIAPANEIRQAWRDFKRPMLGQSLESIGVYALSVYLHGRTLRFGQHPMAEYIVSVHDGLDKCYLLMNEGVIGRDDWNRLTCVLLECKRFPKLPISTPESVEAVARSANGDLTRALRHLLMRQTLDLKPG